MILEACLNKKYFRLKNKISLNVIFAGGEKMKKVLYKDKLPSELVYLLLDIAISQGGISILEINNSNLDLRVRTL